jgi:hypothetical protein
MVSLRQVSTLLAMTSDTCRNADPTDPYPIDAGDAPRVSSVTRYEARNLADRIREACERASVNGTPVPGPVVPLPEPKNQPPDSEPKDTVAGLDAEANRLMDLGLLRLVVLYGGHWCLAQVTDGGMHVLGEVEGLPEGMERRVAPERCVSGASDIYYLIGPDPTDGWPWLSEADRVPATVVGVPISYRLRVRIATVASTAGTLAELSKQTGTLGAEIEAEVTGLANDNGEDGNGSMLVPLMDSLLDPYERQFNTVAWNLFPDGNVGFATDPADRCAEHPRRVQACRHVEIVPGRYQGEYVCEDCDRHLVELVCKVCGLELLPHRLAEHLAQRCWADDSPLVHQIQPRAMADDPPAVPVSAPR